MTKKIKENKFDFDAFRNYTADVVKEWFEGVPDEWKADAAGFVAFQAVTFGARDTYQGVGIFEVTKKEYLDICEQVDRQEQNDCDGMCDNCKLRCN